MLTNMRKNFNVEIGDTVKVSGQGAKTVTEGVVDGIYKNFVNIKCKAGYRESFTFVDIARGYIVITKIK